MGILKLQKVLISDKIADVCVKTFKENGIDVTYRPGLSKSELIEIIPEFNGLIVRSATKVTADVIKAATNLEIIGRAGTGTDNIDIPAASDAGVVVMNTPGGNTNSAAEHTCALILAMCRNLPNRHTELMNGQWNRINGIELTGKTIGIVGLGRIGMIVAHRMQAFGMTTVGYDPFVPADVAAKSGVKAMSLEEMWPVCDFITLHVPLIPSTKHMINADVFGKCKKGVRLVNCARGGIIDEEALLENLNSGKVACAALDVFEEEPPSPQSALLQHSNLIATPHLGASTAEAQTRVAKEIAEQFIALKEATSTFGCMNAPLLRGALGDPTKAKLAKQLGMLLHYLAPQASVIYVQGDNSSFVPHAAMAGYLNAKGVSSANLISITKVAAANGIQFEYAESTDDLTLSSGEVKLSGRFEGEMCFLTKINNNTTLVPLTGNVILLKTSTVAQVLSSVSQQVTGIYFVGEVTVVTHSAQLPSLHKQFDSEIVLSPSLVMA